MKSEFAPAKINLSLHLVGQKSDGYHLLDSIVSFVNVGDPIFKDLEKIYNNILALKSPEIKNHQDVQHYIISKFSQILVNN